MTDGEWQASISEHRDSVRAFTARARGLDAAHWPVPVAEGKWSPAEVAQHLVMTYRHLRSEINGGPAMRIKTKWWVRLLLRATVLRFILGKGRIPRKVRAPRELRPALEDAADRDALLARLEAEAEGFERDLTGRRATARVTHPYFGRVDAAQALRFCTVHTTHHQAQLTPRLEAQ